MGAEGVKYRLYEYQVQLNGCNAAIIRFVTTINERGSFKQIAVGIYLVDF